MTHTGMFLESTQLDLLHAIRRWEAAVEPKPPLVAQSELSELIERDPLFAQWLLKTGHSESNLDTLALDTLALDTLASVCQRLPEDLLNLPDRLAPGLPQAMHQAVQNRLLRQGFATEVRKAKREMLYHLAYGLSHEINNPLANISTRAQLLMPMAKTAKEKQLLGNIVDQSQRAFEMLGDLMQCAKMPQLHPVWLDATELLKTCVDSFARNGFQNVEWIIRAPQEAVRIYSDHDLVTNILEILIQNSLEAISLQGTIIASLSTDQNHCEFLIQDTGNGLSVETRQHAMDPYYSGRDAGRGIGLGLCKANHFTQALGGDLRLEGQLNAGCLASLKLPLSLAQR